MSRNYKFVITHHARQRFVERFSRESVDFLHLSMCRIGCDLCHELTFKLEDLVTRCKQNWDRIITAKLHDADDIRIFHNNSKFMEYMYNNYGFHRYRFLVEYPILFVVREADGVQIVLTCMNVNKPVNGSRILADFVHRPKYRKKVPC